MPTSAPKSPGQLERTLRAGHFAVTAETSPTATTDPAPLVERCRPLRGVADAVNVTDGATAKAHLSSLVVAGALAKAGIEPVLQFTVRDRNRIALQGDLLGAAALGVPNILALTGDDPKRGEEPDAKPVNDMTSTALIALAKKLRDEGKLNSGREIAGPPRLFLGAADAPMDPKPEWKPDSLLGKIAAGADFVQTQYCFDLAMLRRYIARLAEHGIPQQVFILVGIGPLASAKQARWMHENLWGVSIPEPIIKRLDGAADQKSEGRKICAELIQELATIRGVAGAHLMAPRQEAEMAAAIELSGVLQRRGARAAAAGRA
ncbi:MAG TPA: methylenetetrahydrofolate reductase [Alphaproteobacteria bacterium]|jgi:methylenetetrahydrofolate reductase (NADPH)